MDTVACSTVCVCVWVCVCVCASARLCQYQCATSDRAHSSTVLLSNTAEFSCVLYLAVCVSYCPASNHTHTDVQTVCIERTNSSVGSVC